jgi:hypothetical protein
VLLGGDLVAADIVGAKWRRAHGRRQWHCVARERRRQARRCLGVERIRATGKAQVGAHGRRLHVLHMEAGKQVARVGAAAGTSGRSAGGQLRCAIRTTPRHTCVEEIGRVGRPSLSRRGLGPISKWNWTALRIGSGLVNLFQYRKYFPIAIN